MRGRFLPSEHSKANPYLKVQDQYEEDGFIVFGDKNSSEDETDGQEPEKEGNDNSSVCRESKSKKV